MKLPSKKLFYRFHNWIGVQLSMLFFIVCFSGTLAILSSEYDWLFFPEVTKIIWFIGRLAISSLILTGIWIYAKRDFKRKKKKSKIWFYINWTIVVGINFYMFTPLSTGYLASDKFLLILTFFVILLIFSTWYLFVKKIKTTHN